jgi:hypothetical protein
MVYLPLGGRIFLLLLSAPYIAAWISVVPSLAHVPSGIRAACRTTLAKNITQCSQDFQLAPQYIEASTLPAICTDECADALSVLHSEAVSRCGTAFVDIIIDGTVGGVFTPMNLVEQLIYKHDRPCLQDK